jgi:hypothetical protein
MSMKKGLGMMAALLGLFGGGESVKDGSTSGMGVPRGFGGKNRANWKQWKIHLMKKCAKRRAANKVAKLSRRINRGK